MSADNELDQVEALIASDERQSPAEFVRASLKVISEVLPAAKPLVEAVLYRAERQRAENGGLLLATMLRELKRLSSDLEGLRSDSARRDEIGSLILDGIHKTEDLRDRRRVERIGKILAHAIALGPDCNFDKAEEMMRVARDLSDQDVVALRHLYESQFGTFSKAGWKIDVDGVNRIWREHPVKVPGIALPGDLDSTLLKLQSLGLAISVERRDSQLGPNERVFALLPKGADFVRYIQEQSATPQTSSKD